MYGNGLYAVTTWSFVVVAALVVVGLVLLVYRLLGEPRRRREDPFERNGELAKAKQMLDQSYERGEISILEYDERLRELRRQL
jgi:uncharacterized membrane protein